MIEDTNQQADGTGGVDTDTNTDNDTNNDTNTGATETTPDAASAPTGPDEFTLLKQRAKMLKIKHSNNISLEALRAKVNAHIAGETAASETHDDDVANPLAGEKPAEKKMSRKMTVRQKQLKEQLRLVRVRITNLDPKKKDLPGEIFCVANEVIGTVRKYIPYGEFTDAGYHIPYIIYKQLERRRFQHIRTRRKNGQIIVERSNAKEFAIEVLPPLTEEELKRLANAQAAAGSVD
jgi:hypothetical protein